MTTRVSVLCVLSAGRSGSTILGDVLGGTDGFFHAGELRALWGRGLLDGRYCGCGDKVAECSFWMDVVDRAGNGAADPERIYRQQQQHARMRDTIGFLRARNLDSLDPDTRAYARTLGRLYVATAERARVSCIVDTSKRPEHAALLALVDDLDVSFVHLVRDPRAVANSWRRAKAGPAGPMATYPAWVSARGWLMRNLAVEAVRRRYPERTRVVAYESFMEQPRATIAALASLVGSGPAAGPFIDDHTVRLARIHSSGGNPDRFREGPVRLRRDDRWLSEASGRENALVSAIALPLLRRYGYRVRPQREPGGAPRPTANYR